MLLLCIAIIYLLCHCFPDFFPIIDLGWSVVSENFIKYLTGSNFIKGSCPFCLTLWYYKRASFCVQKKLMRWKFILPVQIKTGQISPNVYCNSLQVLLDPHYYQFYSLRRKRTVSIITSLHIAICCTIRFICRNCSGNGENRRYCS